MLALPRLGINYGNLMSGATSPQPSRERSGHVPQLAVVEIRVAAVELPPPRAEPPTGLAHRKVGVEHHPIHAIVGSLQQLGVITGQLISRIHPTNLTPVGRSFRAVRSQRTSFSQRKSGKRRSTSNPGIEVLRRDYGGGKEEEWWVCSEGLLGPAANGQRD